MNPAAIYAHGLQAIGLAVLLVVILRCALKAR